MVTPRLHPVGKAILLLAWFVVLFVGGSALVMPAGLPGMQPLTEAEQQASGVALLAVAAMDVAILWLAIAWSRLQGWRLAMVVGAALYFCMTFTSNLEAWYFMPNVDGAVAARLMAMTLPLAVLWSPVAVGVLGRNFRGPNEAERYTPPGGTEAILKALLLGVVVYPLLFFAFGYFVAYASPEVRAFYGGVRAETFIAHVHMVAREDPRLLALEALRGLMWVACAWVLVRTTTGPAWRRAALVVLFFSIVQNNLHLLPNPLMPHGVRMAHLVETASSNALFALLCTVLLVRSHAGWHGTTRTPGTPVTHVAHATGTH